MFQSRTTKNVHELLLVPLLGWITLGLPSCKDDDKDAADAAVASDTEPGADAAVRDTGSPAKPNVGEETVTVASAEGDEDEEELTVAMPYLGGPVGRLVKGWDGLKPKMKSRRLKKFRPKANASDVSGLVWSEPLSPPWLAASYRFDRKSKELAEVRWVLSQKASGPKVFKALVRQGMSRWQVRPRTQVEPTQRTASWQTGDGKIFVRMEEGTGRIRLEWFPPTTPEVGLKLPQLQDLAGTAAPPDEGTPAPQAR